MKSYYDRVKDGKYNQCWIDCIDMMFRKEFYAYKKRRELYIKNYVFYMQCCNKAVYDYNGNIIIDGEVFITFDKDTDWEDAFKTNIHNPFYNRMNTKTNELPKRRQAISRQQPTA